MAKSYASAVRTGTMAAARLHRRLGLLESTKRHGGAIEVFGTIDLIEVPLLLRPLQGLLGAYLRDPAPGILVTSQRPMSIQRFTAAHELGHAILRHEPSLDGENMLRRMPLVGRPGGNNLQEVEADAFAAEFMMPHWLIAHHAARQGWNIKDFARPDVVYQLSLRIGASYEATCWTLVRHQYLGVPAARQLLTTRPRSLKITLLEGYKPKHYRGDVWRLTELDTGVRIDGSRDDLFVLCLQEHSGGGYLWNIDELRASGFGVVRDDCEAVDGPGVGGPAIRRVTAAPPEPHCGRLSLDERRPWEPDQPLSSIRLRFDLTGPEEEGFSRAERRRLLQAA